MPSIPRTGIGRLTATVGVAICVLAMTACAGAARPAPDAAPSGPGGAPRSSQAQSAETLFNTGQERLQRGEYSAAAESFDRCIAADPDHAYAYYYAGMSYREVGRLDLMANRFEMFVKLAPDAPERPRVEVILRSLER